MGTSLKISDLALLGRVGNAGVTPLSFPGLHRWYDATSFTGIAADGETIGGAGQNHGPWPEKVFGVDNATGSGIFKTNQVGTQPIIRFNFHFEFLPGVLNDFTILYLAKTTSPDNSFLFYHFTTGHQIRQLFSGVHSCVFYAGAAVITSDVFPGNNFDVCEIKRSAGNITFRQNMTDRGSGFENTPWTVHQLGTSAVANVADVGEILMYNTALSTANVNQLYNEYLKPKWVTLP